MAGFIQAKPSPEPQKIDIDIDDNLWDKLRDNFFDSELFDGEVGSTIKNVYKLVKDGDGGLGSIKNIYKLVRELVRRKKRSAGLDTNSMFFCLLFVKIIDLPGGQINDH